MIAEKITAEKVKNNYRKRENDYKCAVGVEISCDSSTRYEKNRANDFFLT